MAKDAIQGYLEVLKELGEEIPKEKENIIISKVELEVK
jgi:predicted RNase H-like HicB family nuclease